MSSVTLYDYMIYVFCHSLELRTGGTYLKRNNYFERIVLKDLYFVQRYSMTDFVSTLTLSLNAEYLMMDILRIISDYHLEIMLDILRIILGYHNCKNDVYKVKRVILKQ